MLEYLWSTSVAISGSKSERPPAEVLAPIPAEIRDQIVREGPLTAEDIETASERFKDALIVRALGVS